MSSRTSEETASPQSWESCFCQRKRKRAGRLSLVGISRKLIRNSHGHKILIEEIRNSHGHENFDETHVRWENLEKPYGEEIPSPFLSSSWTHVHNYLKSDKPDIKSFCSRPLPLQLTSKLSHFQLFKFSSPGENCVHLSGFELCKPWLNSELVWLVVSIHIGILCPSREPCLRLTL